jgi:hypothetical protein
VRGQRRFDDEAINDMGFSVISPDCGSEMALDSFDAVLPRGGAE